MRNSLVAIQLLLVAFILISFCEAQLLKRTYGPPTGCRIDTEGNCGFNSCLMFLYDSTTSFAGAFGAKYCVRFTDRKYRNDRTVWNWVTSWKRCTQKFMLDSLNREMKTPKDHAGVEALIDSLGLTANAQCISDPQTTICELPINRIRTIVGSIDSINTRNTWGYTNGYEKAIRAQFVRALKRTCKYSENNLRKMAPEIFDP